MNPKNNLEFNTDFFMVDVATTKFVIYDNASKKGIVISDVDYRTKFGMNLNFLHNVEDELLKIETSINIELFDKNIKPLGVTAEFTFEVVFEVKNFSEKLSCLVENKDAIETELSLLLKLCNLSYGTIRGLLIERTNNTALQGFILPFITDATFEKIIQKR